MSPAISHNARVLLLGARGQLGRDVSRRIARDRPGWVVAAPPREIIDLSRPIDEQLEPFGSAGLDLVINCAAYNDVAQAEIQPGAALAINAYAVRDLARACNRAGAHLVHVSTDYVFGAALPERPRREDDAPGPINVYGVSKLMGESLVAATAQSWTICRVASLFGVAGRDGTRGNFVERLLARAAAGSPIEVVDNRFMSPTATADAARAIVGLADLRLQGIYHVVNGGIASWWDFAREILDAGGYPGYPTARRQDRIEHETPPVRPLYTVLDNSKAAHALGYAMDDWRIALRRYLAEKTAGST